MGSEYDYEHKNEHGFGLLHKRSREKKHDLHVTSKGSVPSVPTNLKSKCVLPALLTPTITDVSESLSALSRSTSLRSRRSTRMVPWDLDVRDGVIFTLQPLPYHSQRESLQDLKFEA